MARVSTTTKTHLKRYYPKQYAWYKRHGLVEERIWEILLIMNARGIPDYDPDKGR